VALVNGNLIFFNPEKGHGFIRTEDGERLLVRVDGFAPGHLLGDRCAGTPLTFERVEGDEPSAVNVMTVPLTAARRARSRRH
jgi:cold shock CspA family protein